VSDPVATLIEGMEQQNPARIRAAYADDARLLAMTPNTFQIHEGADAAAAKIGEWFAGWERDPRWTFIRVHRDGGRAVVEFERASTFEDEPWVTRQAHVLEVTGEGIVEHRMYCCGPRAGAPELAEALAGSAS
jgi:hypothetical protein